MNQPISLMEYFRNPGKDIQLFDYNPEKLKIIADKLLLGYLWLPDETRTKEGVLATMSVLFPIIHQGSGPNNIYYEIGNFSGIIGFFSVFPEYKCDLILKLWDRGVWGPTLVRDVKTLLSTFMREWKLRRMGFQSADDRSVRIMKMLGFKVEGTQKNAFKFDGKLYTNYLYRKVREV